MSLAYVHIYVSVIFTFILNIYLVFGFEFLPNCPHVPAATTEFHLHSLKVNNANFAPAQCQLCDNARCATFSYHHQIFNTKAMKRVRRSMWIQMWNQTNQGIVKTVIPPVRIPPIRTHYTRQNGIVFCIVSILDL